MPTVAHFLAESRIKDVSQFIRFDKHIHQKYGFIVKATTNLYADFMSLSLDDRKELIGQIVTFLNAAVPDEKYTVSVLLFRLFDFCFWDAQSEQYLMTILTRVTLLHVIGLFLPPGGSPQHSASSYESSTLQGALILGGMGDSEVNYSADFQSMGAYADEFYVVAFDYLLCKVSHIVTPDSDIFELLVEAVLRQIPYLTRFSTKAIEINLLASINRMLAHFMKNQYLQALLVTDNIYNRKLYSKGKDSTWTINTPFVQQVAIQYFARPPQKSQFITNLLNIVTHFGSLDTKVGAGAMAPAAPAAPGQVGEITDSARFLGTKAVSEKVDADIPVIFATLLPIWVTSYLAQTCITNSGFLVLASRLLKNKAMSSVTRVVRVTLKTLVNLLDPPTADYRGGYDDDGNSLVQKMIATRLDKTLDQLLARSWPSEEDSGLESVVDLVKRLRALLDKSVVEITTWETYQVELTQPLIEATPVHFSESFWKHNNARLLDDGSAALHKLLDIADKAFGTDPTTVYVVLNDFGMFCSSHPNGKAILSTIKGVKEFVAKCLTHADDKIKNTAILTLSKMIIDNWKKV